MGRKKAGGDGAEKVSKGPWKCNECGFRHAGALVSRTECDQCGWDRTAPEPTAPSAASSVVSPRLVEPLPASPGAAAETEVSSVTFPRLACRVGCDVALRGLEEPFADKNGLRGAVIAWNADLQKWEVMSPDGTVVLMPEKFLKVIDSKAEPLPASPGADAETEVSSVKQTRKQRRKQKQHQKPSNSPPVSFAPAGAGQLAASAAPQKHGTVAAWKAAGATAVVTLLRADEPAFEEASKQIKAAGLRWLHLPLSGKKAVTEPLMVTAKAKDDPKSLALVGEVAALLQRGEAVVIHCAAGMHRTGFMCYLALRLVGQSPQMALKSILATRPITHEETTKVTRATGLFMNWPS